MSGRIQKEHAMAALVLGSCELIVGIVVTVCSFVLSSKSSVERSATPYWAGIAFIVPGVVGIVTGATRNKCVLISFMVVNIICFILSGIGSVLILLVLAFWVNWSSANCNIKVVLGQAFCHCNINGETNLFAGEACDFLQNVSTLLYVIVAFLILGAIVALAASIVGCVSLCCSRNVPETVVVQQPYGMTNLNAHGGGDLNVYN